MTRVSILTPSYGYARFLPDALDSVASQGGVEIEHVVQDGGSTDGTVDLLAGRSGVVWTTEPDAGQSDALNRALERSTGSWIGWLNADEFYLPDAISRLVATAERAEADVAFGDAVFVDEDGRLLRLLARHPMSRTVLRWYGTTISSCGVLFRREALGAEPWMLGLRRIMDWELFLRLADRGARFAYLPVPVGAFRVHDAQVTSAPPSDSAAEYRWVAERHRLRWPSPRLPGRALHGALKLSCGGYRRERAVSRLVGTDLRWFRSDVGRLGAQEVLERCARRQEASGCAS